MRTPEELKSCRIALYQIYGPGMLVLSDKIIDETMDKLVNGINAHLKKSPGSSVAEPINNLFNDHSDSDVIEDDVELIEFVPSQLTIDIHRRLKSMNIKTAREFMETDKAKLLTVMTEDYYNYLMDVFTEEFN